MRIKNDGDDDVGFKNRKKRIFATDPSAGSPRNRLSLASLHFITRQQTFDKMQTNKEHVLWANYQ
jgi:hypothetical protein